MEASSLTPEVQPPTPEEMLAAIQFQQLYQLHFAQQLAAAQQLSFLHGFPGFMPVGTTSQQLVGEGEDWTASSREQTPNSSRCAAPNIEDEPLNLSMKERSTKKKLKKEKKYKKYSPQQMEKAIELTFLGVKKKEAAKQCNVPSRTLYQKLSELQKGKVKLPLLELQGEPQDE